MQEVAKRIPNCFQAPPPVLLEDHFRYPEDIEPVIYTLVIFWRSIPAQADCIIRLTDISVSVPVRFQLHLQSMPEHLPNRHPQRLEVSAEGIVAFRQVREVIIQLHTNSDICAPAGAEGAGSAIQFRSSAFRLDRSTWSPAWTGQRSLM